MWSKENLTYFSELLRGWTEIMCQKYYLHLVQNRIQQMLLPAPICLCPEKQVLCEAGKTWILILIPPFPPPSSLSLSFFLSSLPLAPSLPSPRHPLVNWIAKEEFRVPKHRKNEEALYLSLRYQCGLEDFPAPFKSLLKCHCPCKKNKYPVNWKFIVSTVLILCLVLVSPQISNPNCLQQVLGLEWGLEYSGVEYSVVGCFPWKCKALGLIPRIEKKN